MDMKRSTPRRLSIAILATMLIATSVGVVPSMASSPDWKLVDTTVISVTFTIPEIPGIPPELVGETVTIFLVAHINTVGKWVVEPTAFVEWPPDSGMCIPVDGEFWTATNLVAQVKIYVLETRISIHGAQIKYTGTMAIMPLPPLPPDFPPELLEMLPPYIPMPKKGQLNMHVVIKIGGVPSTFKAHLIVKFTDFVPKVLLAKVG